MKRPLLILVLAALALGAGGCEDDPVDDRELWAPSWPPPPATPEAAVQWIAAVYNDKSHSADVKLGAYAQLLAPEFEFVYQTAISPPVGSWGLETELAAHRNMFSALESGTVYMLELQLMLAPAEDLDPPDPAREGWQEIFATSVYLRLMLTPSDGFEVDGAQGNFVLAPVAGGHWAIAEWTDPASPAPRMALQPIEPTTWAGIKARFLE